MGTLRVATSVTIARFAIAPLLAGFLAQFPKVSVSVEASNRYVDLIAGGHDMAVRAHELALDDSTLISRVVARTPWSLAASPEWVSQSATVSAPEDLIGLDALYFGAVQGEPRWAFSRGGDKTVIRPSPRLRSDDMGMLKHAATESLGCVSLPTYVLRDALSAGRLVPLLRDWQMPVAAMSVITPPRRQSSRLAKTFSDYLAKNLPRLLEPTHPTPAVVV